MGAVKTRLAVHIGAAEALLLYKAFVADILETITAMDVRLRIFYYPPGQYRLIREWLGGGRRFSAQRGKDLGERLYDAFCRTAQEGFEKIVLVGSDIPELDESVITGAFSALEKNQAVIGPAADGGYYLAGLRRGSVCKQVFAGIDWGTGRVLDQTLERFGEKGLSVETLRCLSDIDSVDDLMALSCRLKAKPDLAARIWHTRKTLMETRGI